MLEILLACSSKAVLNHSDKNKWLRKISVGIRQNVEKKRKKTLVIYKCGSIFQKTFKIHTPILTD